MTCQTFNTTAAVAHLEAGYRAAVIAHPIGMDKVTWPMARAANLPHLRRRPCSLWQCATGHTLTRVCVGCTRVGGAMSSSACGDHHGN